MKSALIFCGANSGRSPVYTEVARQLGKTLAQQNITIVYGAGKVGLMGEVAEAALAQGGEVIGVIPFFLRKKEVAHEELTKMYVVDSMHERKIKMAQLSDAVIVLPGGYGTMDELFELLTLSQVGQGQHPIVIVNTNGYFSPLLAQLDLMVAEGFLKPIHRQLTMVCDDVEGAIKLLQDYEPPAKEGKWIKL
jgi:uncharacterized protein (TIGR00730 family)